MKKNKSIILGLILLVLIIGSLSYALWAFSFEQEKDNVLKTKIDTEVITGCFSVSFKEDSVANAITLDKVFPLSDADGNSQDDYYKFSIVNTCTKDVNFEVNLEVLPDTTLSPLPYRDNTSQEYTNISYSLDGLTSKILGEQEVVSASVAGASKSYKIATGSLTGASEENGTNGGRATYSLRLWLNNSSVNEDMHKKFVTKVVVVSTADE